MRIGVYTVSVVSMPAIDARYNENNWPQEMWFTQGTNNQQPNNRTQPTKTNNWVEMLGFIWVGNNVLCTHMKFSIFVCATKGIDHISLSADLWFVEPNNFCPLFWLAEKWLSFILVLTGHWFIAHIDNWKWFLFPSSVPYPTIIYTFLNIFNSRSPIYWRISRINADIAKIHINNRCVNVFDQWSHSIHEARVGMNEKLLPQISTIIQTEHR